MPSKKDISEVRETVQWLDKNPNSVTYFASNIEHEGHGYIKMDKLEKIREKHPDLYAILKFILYIARMRAWIYHQQLRRSFLEFDGNKLDEIHEFKTIVDAMGEMRIENMADTDAASRTQIAYGVTRDINRNLRIVEVLEQYDGQLKLVVKDNTLVLNEPASTHTFEFDSKTSASGATLTFKDVTNFLAEIKMGQRPSKKINELLHVVADAPPVHESWGPHAPRRKGDISALGTCWMTKGVEIGDKRQQLKVLHPAAYASIIVRARCFFLETFGDLHKIFALGNELKKDKDKDKKSLGKGILDIFPMIIADDNSKDKARKVYTAINNLNTYQVYNAQTGPAELFSWALIERDLKLKWEKKPIPNVFGMMPNLPSLQQILEGTH